ncbi:hypothetical protein ACFE04_030962 [Oxalis oulophora]
MAKLLLSFFVFTLLVLHSAEEPNDSVFECGGSLGSLRFPFANSTYYNCDVWLVNCSSVPRTIQFAPGGSWLQIKNITQANQVSINDSKVKTLLKNHSCQVFDYLAIGDRSQLSYKLTDQNLYVEVMKCDNKSIIEYKPYLENRTCGEYNFYYNGSNDISIKGKFPQGCSALRLPRHPSPGKFDPFTMLTAEFTVSVKHVPYECYYCHRKSDGSCKEGHTKLWTGLGTGLGFVILIIICFILVFKCYKRKKFLSGTNRGLFSSKSDLEGGSTYFGVSVFSHRELEEATNNFDSKKELGDGGFGIVYHGKLRDGREVAVKRLFEHNYKRVQQFMNEIKILTLLRHKNLVTLYGCTSRRSHELLLVYEYIPNGTVADHLHDFGLSRLFPLDVTHVSTAPQGTPGYVDPDYHECYQLTTKSDVYSFGVVLIELISSMPAVDINRHRHEINLSSYAIHKIQKCEFDKLIDKSLGYKTYKEIRRMTTSVAELAFRCLQQDKEMRPSMQEVFEELEMIQKREYKPENDKIDEDEKSGEYKFEKRNLEDSSMNENSNDTQRQSSLSPECDDMSLLENIKLPPSSPITVTAKWISTNTTPNNST